MCFGAAASNQRPLLCLSCWLPCNPKIRVWPDHFNEGWFRRMSVPVWMISVQRVFILECGSVYLQASTAWHSLLRPRNSKRPLSTPRQRVIVCGKFVHSLSLRHARDAPWPKGRPFEATCCIKNRVVQFKAIIVGVCNLFIFLLTVRWEVLYHV